MKLVKCPTCKGDGIQTIHSTETTSKGVTKRPPMNFPCVVCNGKGKVTEAYVKAVNIFWCKCENPGDPVFYNDGENPNCSKHCWVCSTCGKVQQVG